MKKTLLILAAAAAVAMPVDARSHKSAERHAVPERSQRVEQAVARVQAANEKKVWKPGTITDYYWAQTDWALSYTTLYEYYEETGLIKSETNDYSRYEYEYNEDGYVSVSYSYMIWDGEMELDTKSVYTYDDVIPGLWIERLDYYYNGDEFELGYGSRRTITRNEDGNVTKYQSEWYTPYNDDDAWSSDYYLAIEYGADGKATRISQMDREYGTDDWYMEEMMENIEWYATDGQIIDNDWDDEDFYMGANRIKSADVKLEFSTVPGKLTVVYTGEKSFKYELTVGEEVMASMDYESLDEYGSNEKTEFAIDYDFDEDTNQWVRDEAYTYWRKRIYDAFGYELYNSTKEYYDGVLDYESERVTTPTYNEEYGYPVEYVMTRASDGAEPENASRTVLSDYVQVTDGVESVVAGDENAPVEYFNLQGVRVVNPQGGVFIRRQGTAVTKVAL